VTNQIPRYSASKLRSTTNNKLLPLPIRASKPFVLYYIIRATTKHVAVKKLLAEERGKLGATARAIRASERLRQIMKRDKERDGVTIYAAHDETKKCVHLQDLLVTI